MYIYQFKLVCRCPNDRTVNIYDVEVQAKSIIEVEEFNKFQDKYYEDFIFQEDLFELLKEYCNNLGSYNSQKVQVVGYHNGVKVITK
tara:strand:+ start:693 stop:953 length:261 start_codon:yes stop_codon:yes gene_type:complete